MLLNKNQIQSIRENKVTFVKNFVSLNRPYDFNLISDLIEENNLQVISKSNHNSLKDVFQIREVMNLLKEFKVLFDFLNKTFKYKHHEQNNIDLFLSFVSQAGIPHTDEEDVFIIGLNGNMIYKVFNDKIIDYKISKGDLIYIPKGVKHKVIGISPRIVMSIGFLAKEYEKRKSKIENFIGVYDGYIPDSQCNDAIDLFNEKEKLKKTYDRILIENTTKDKKNDKAIDIQSCIEWPTRFKPIMLNIDQVMNHYSKHTSIKEFYDVPSFEYTYIKIQKTLPTEGYHVWHLEHGASMDSAFRALVFSVYLNDVKEGGETEFLNQAMRIKPKKGRVVVFPAGFPYVHRGNQPMKGEKYLMTSWFLLPKK